MAAASTVAEYLNAVAQKAVFPSVDKGMVNVSLNMLTTRLAAEFDKYTVARINVFGAYARDTMLPVSMNPRSDVDVMVVFTDSAKKPQDFLAPLKKFAESHYPKPAIVQGPATINLELRHIRFELIPAIDTVRLGGLHIPSKVALPAWQGTSPDDIEKSLKVKDQAGQGLILPLVRLVKYWNALNQFPFESFDLEKRVIAHSFALTPKNIKAYFFDFMRGLNTGHLPPTGKQECVRALRKTFDEIDQLALSGQQQPAIARMALLLPMPGR